MESAFCGKLDIVRNDLGEELSILLGLLEIGFGIGNVLGEKAGNIFLLALGVLDQDLGIDSKEQKDDQAAEDYVESEAVKPVYVLSRDPRLSRVLRGLLHEYPSQIGYNGLR